MSAPTFEYTTLKQAVTKRSPLRDYLHSTFPNRKPIAAAYRKSAGPILAPGFGRDAATIGTAFDNLLRLDLAPTDIPIPALRGALKVFDGMGDLEEIVGLLTGFCSIASESEEALARTAWIFALFTEAFRHPLLPESLVDALNDEGNLSVDSLLALASKNAVEDMLQLRAIAQSNFYPLLKGPLEVGPTFNEELPISADGDLIDDRTLIELKTTVGETNSKGQRYAVLDAGTLYQLLAYTLIDTNDEHKINALGVYSSRYGHYFRLDLVPLLEELAGQPIDLARERENVRAMICGDWTA